MANSEVDLEKIKASIAASSETIASLMDQSETIAGISKVVIGALKLIGLRQSWFCNPSSP